MPELDAETKARIEAEEKYRASLQAKPVQKPPASLGCGPMLAIAAIALIVFLVFTANYHSPTEYDQSSAPDHTDGALNFAQACQRLGNEQLHAPASASWPNPAADWGTSRLTYSDTAGYEWLGNVDSQNAFGAQVRTAFDCTQPMGEPGPHIQLVAR